MLADCGAQPVGVVDARRHGVAGVFEEPREACPQQRLVLGDHYPHGSSAVTTVPASGELSMRSRPPSAATRSPMPTRPDPPEAAAPPMPSSRTETTRLPLRLLALS